MTNKEIILKTIRFIEENLSSEISVLDIASEGCYSLYHFIRLFQSITGISPNKYLMQRRLTEAAYQLRDTDKKVIEIAFEYQFGSHESFTRQFSKYFGISPIKIRNGHPLTNLPLYYPVSEEYIYQSGKIKDQLPELVKLDETMLAGFSFFYGNVSKISSLAKEWSQLGGEVHTIKNRIIPERYYQVQFWSENQDLGGLYFFIGVEVTATENISPQFVLKTIPKGKYLKFIHKGLVSKVGYTYKYIYNQFLPETDYKLTQPFNFEFYGKKCLGPNNEKSESEIYIPIDL